MFGVKKYLEIMLDLSKPTILENSSLVSIASENLNEKLFRAKSATFEIC